MPIQLFKKNNLRVNTQVTTPLSTQMKLIRPGKQRVKVTANAVENILSKQMRKSD